MMAWFAYFQCAYSIVPNPDGPLLMAVPVSKIRAANREVKPVLGYPAQQRGRNPTPAFQCSVNGCGELGYHKSAKVFSVKNYFLAIRKSFHPQKKPAIRVLQALLSC